MKTSAFLDGFAEFVGAKDFCVGVADAQFSRVLPMTGQLGASMAPHDLWPFADCFVDYGLPILPAAPAIQRLSIVESLKVLLVV